MRLTCPNCGAQYEVPDEVIPSEGRDVQCSNCGDTWFQDHPNNIEAEELANDGMAASAPETAPEDQDSHPENDQQDAGDDSAPRDAPDQTPEDSEPTPQQSLDPAVSEILRQEAEHETQLRAAENREGLESQADLGLDNLPDDEAARRAREASDRMARMRGEDPEEIDHPTDPGSRRGLLPDIEEINSTLRASGDGSSQQAVVGTVAGPQQSGRGGFARGFGLILLITVILVLIYANAHKIAAALPQSETALNAYVELIDQGRVWLDTKVGGFLPK